MFKVSVSNSQITLLKRVTEQLSKKLLLICLLPQILESDGEKCKIILTILILDTDQ